MSKSIQKFPLRIAVAMGKYKTGGVKSVIMNYYKNIDRSIVQFDFFVYKENNSTDYSEIESLGGRVYEISSLRHPIKHILSVAKILKQENYKIIHGYMNTLNVFPMLAGRLAGVPVRISENLSTAHKSERKTIIKKFLLPFQTLFPTNIAANSEYAAEWMYGKKRMDKCKIFPNALDLNLYTYNESIRNEIRKELDIKDCFVIGHIGRYEYQKNHDFLIDIFNSIHKKDPCARLLLIGYGSLKEQIMEKICKLDLSDFIIDAGATENIMPYYNAMDCFVLPSFYEGLPVVGIEAQATGLPCVMSTEVTKETKVTDDVEFIDLNKDADFWAERILKWKNHNRQKKEKELTQNGYNIKNEAAKLVEYYKDCLSY